MKNGLPGAVPEIPVRDLKYALAYFENHLGFTVDWRSEDSGLAGISHGDCRLFLASATYRQDRGNGAPIVVWLNVNSKDEVNDLYNVWSKSNARLISEPESKPWGLHEFTAEDRDGNMFRVFYDFATPNESS